MGRYIEAARIAAAYAGTVVGSGFASGQELLQFFVAYGPVGLLSMFLAGLLFALAGSTVLDLGYRLRATGYHQVLHYVCGRRLGVLLDGCTAFFLVGGLCVMLSGTGAVCRDYFGLSHGVGAAVMALAASACVLGGVKGISNVNLLVMPLLIGATAAVCFSSLAQHSGQYAMLLAFPAEVHLQPAGHWLTACFLYVSYNIILGATLLAPLGRRTPDAIARRLGGVLGGVLLAALGLMIITVIILHHPAIMDYEVPMLYVSHIQDGMYYAGYAAMLLKAMFSTSMASLYGCTAKLQTVTRLPFGGCLALVAALGILGSQFGFASLVAVLYPLFGYAALPFTGAILWKVCRGR